MQRRRRLLYLSLAAVVVGLAVAWEVWPPSTAITLENVAKIREGMTLAEVEAVLGGPARDEGIGEFKPATPADESDFGSVLVGATGPGNPHEWLSDDVWVLVVFDGDSVVSASSASVRRETGGPLDRLRRWLGL